MAFQKCLFLTILTIVSGSHHISYYDAFHGEEISEEEYDQHVQNNSASWCTNVLEECDPNEWRRVDGSCNNLDHPNRGMSHTPTLRLLKPAYSGNSEEGYDVRKSKCGKPLPLERPLRTNLIPQGRIPDQVFTQMTTHFLVFTVPDILSIHDTLNYLFRRPYCCLPEGKEDNQCLQVKIPNDDPVHRFSNLRCMRITRPLTYQTQGCLKSNTIPERIISATPSLDLSHIYGLDQQALDSKGRLFEGGLLKYEVENGIVWPPSMNAEDAESGCPLNQKPNETRCHDTPESRVNGLLGGNLVVIWFWRMHNYIANGLAKVNPCWDDDKLFYTAREINIAYMIQIFFYELLATLMGAQNLQNAGVLSPSPGFRDMYDNRVLPQVSLEYGFVLRWFHVIQENELKMYDEKGNYVKSIPMGNITLRTGWLGIGNNLGQATQGSIRQGCAKIGNLVDPDIAEIGLGPATEGTDIVTFDLVKNRHYGVQPYIKFLEFCYGRPFNSFEDLVGIIKPEMLEILQKKYKHVEDIDLMAALWVELPAEGSFLPKTLQCLMIDQLVRFVVSDRHWYERPNRPHAFNSTQLLEIRKARVSRLLCNVGDTITEIQPNGFLRTGPGNEMIKCEEIPDIDFQAWKDPSCDRGSSTSGTSSYSTSTETAK